MTRAEGSVNTVFRVNTKGGVIRRYLRPIREANERVPGKIVMEANVFEACNLNTRCWNQLLHFVPSGVSVLTARQMGRWAEGERHTKWVIFRYADPLICELWPRGWPCFYSKSCSFTHIHSQLI